MSISHHSGARGLEYPSLQYYNVEKQKSRFLFPLLKRALHGMWFAMDAEVRTSVQKIFKEIPLEEFQKSLMVKWQEHR